MSGSTRWTLLVLAVVAVVIAGFASQLGGPGPDHGEGAGPAVPGADSSPAGAAALTEIRRRADLVPCPSGGAGPGPPALRGFVVECAADGGEVDAAEALAGRPVVLNLWAYWCVPCAEELPAMAEYQRRVGSAQSVVTVHQDRNQGAGLQRLAELGVRLPTFQDGARRIAAALRVPNVMPATVVLRADGTVADILPRAFVDADEIAVAIREALR